jgi:hypothetical protein
LRIEAGPGFRIYNGVGNPNAVFINADLHDFALCLTDPAEPGDPCYQPSYSSASASGNVTDWIAASTAASVPYGADATGWLDPYKATVPDSQAQCNLAAGTVSELLRIWGFNFAAEIPAGAILRGIEVRVTRGALLAYAIRDALDGVNLFVNDMIGNSKFNGAWWPHTGFEQVIYGSLDDDWGVTMDDVRTSAFGITVRAECIGSAATALFKYLEMRVGYDLP